MSGALVIDAAADSHVAATQMRERNEANVPIASDSLARTVLSWRVGTANRIGLYLYGNDHSGIIRAKYWGAVELRAIIRIQSWGTCLERPEPEEHGRRVLACRRRTMAAA